MVQNVNISNCTCCKLHVLQIACIADYSCCKVVRWVSKVQRCTNATVCKDAKELTSNLVTHGHTERQRDGWAFGAAVTPKYFRFFIFSPCEQKKL